MLNSVTHVTYSRVAKDAVPKEAKHREHDAALDAFLLEHVDALRGFASGKNACPATFVDDEARDLFEELRTGGPDDFLDAAYQITTRLIDEMTGATAEGLLVCVQIKNTDTMTAAVLKLQVVAPNAANLETLDSGEELLSAVKDVMDAPGKLQKGALIGDPRPNSDVIVGDVASKEAQYFPRAFGISIEQRPGLAAVDTLRAVRELYGGAVEVATRDAMPKVSSGTTAEVLEELGSQVPELKDAPARRAIVDRLTDRPRPVRIIDTSTPLVEYITASGITIKAPITGRERVAWKPDEVDGGYVITIRVGEEPRREVR